MSNFNDPLKNVDPWEHIQERKKDAERPTWDSELIGKMIQNMSAKPNLKQVKPVDTYELESGEILFNVHKPEKCAGRPCAIHGASDHPLAEKPRSWVNGLIYRTCDHRVAHPDFDSLAARLDASGWVYEKHQCCAGKCCGIPEVVDIFDEDR